MSDTRREAVRQTQKPIGVTNADMCANVDAVVVQH